MKKTRILASLLSLMMIVCMLPVVQVSAEVPANLPEAIGAVVGTNYAAPAPAVNNANMNLDFTVSGVENTPGLEAMSNSAAQPTYSPTEGLVFGAAEVNMHYMPLAATVWNVFDLSEMYAFGFKMQSDDGRLEQLTHVTKSTTNRAYVDISSSAVLVDRSATSVTYQPGVNEWHDCLVKKNDNGGYDVYMKKRTDPQFTLLQSTTSFPTGGTLATDGLRFCGRNVAISYAIAYQGANLSTYNSIDEILGGPTGSTYALDFDANSSFARTPDRPGGFLDNFAWGNPIPSKSSNYKFDEDGLTLKVSPSDTDEYWLSWGPYFYWSPLNALNSQEGLYSRQALYLKAKGNFNLRMKGPKSATRMEIQVAVGSDIGTDCCTPETLTSVTIANEWTEYLVVPDEVVSGFPATAALYVKGESATGGKWWKTKKITFGTTIGSDANSNVGLSFCNVTGHIKSVRTLAITDSISDVAATPEGADYLYFNEEFDAATEYANKTTTKVNYAGGNAVFGGDSSQNAKLTVNDLAIPEGGYAEFKVQYDGIAQYRIHAGDKLFNVTQQSDCGSITSGNSYTGNNNTSWRTWRFVKNDGTYNVYSKTEGDTGWFVHETNGGVANDGDVKIELEFTAANDGTTSESKVAYLKVYGPSQGGDLVLTDGNTTKVVSGNEELMYPQEVYVKAKAGSSKRMLIYAEYGADDILTRIEKTDIPADSGTLALPYDLSDSEKNVSKYQFFLWDNYSSMRSLSPKKTVPGKIEFWTQDWKLTGGAIGTSKELLVTSENGEESSAELSGGIERQFDITWKMKMDSFDGKKTVQVYSGNYLTEFNLQEDGITYKNRAGETYSPWSLDTKEHLYRLIGNGNTTALLIDGYDVASMESLVYSAESAKFRVQNTGSEDATSTISISHFESNAYSASNLPVKGFYHTFETGLEGWYGPTNANYQPWEVVDGNLQAVDPTSKVPTFYTSRSIPIADDYTFMMRMQIESFGNDAGCYIYMKDYTLGLDFKQMFFGLRTADSARSGEGDYIETTGYSDQIKIDPAKWYDLRVETYNHRKSARVYLDNVKIMEGDLAENPTENRVITLTANGSATDPAIFKIDWFKCAPIQYEVAMTSPADGTVYQEGTSISLAATTNVASGNSVKYMMNGNVVATGSGTSNAAVLTGLPAGTYEITAVSGTAVSSPVNIKVQKQVSQKSLPEIEENKHYANEITYTANGDGTVQFGNGNHLLEMTHSGGKVSYRTADNNVETYDYGTGDFHIVTEGPVADVYRNGRLVFSYFMPMTEEVTATFSGAISGGTAEPTPERKTYYVARNVTDQKKTYQLADLPHQHVLDFVADSQDTVHLALNDGYYRNDISLENGEIYVWNGQRNNSLMEKTKVASMESGKEVYYRVESSAGMSRLYGNGRWIATFRGAPTAGGDALSVDVTSGSLKYLAVSDNTDVFLHQDDFSGNEEDDSIGYWMLSGMTASVDSTNQNLALSSTATGFAELSPSCGNVELSANVTIGNAEGFWFSTNHVLPTTYNKVGYNFTTGKYEIVDIKDGVEVDSESQSGTLPIGQPVSMKVRVQENEDAKTVTLYVNGDEVLSKVSKFDCRGRVGFLLQNGNATVDDVLYRGDAKTIYGEHDHTDATVGFSVGNTTDLIENDQTGQVYMVNTSGGSVTSDGGKTWSTVSGLAGRSPHMVQLQDSKNKNTVLSVTFNYTNQTSENGQTKTSHKVYKSSNYGMTWEYISGGDTSSPNIEDPAVGNGATVNALKQGYSGRFYFVHGNGTSEDYGGAVVWYSDNGRKWNRSKTEIDAKALGFVIAEGIVIETRKFTRLYFRTDKGSLGYFTSNDFGETWDLTPHMTPFISSANCFNIDVDPEDPDTLYIAWVYTNVNLFARHQFPRSRVSVARSTDAGETWEMIGTVHEDTSHFLGNTNLNIAVSSEDVFVNAYNRTGGSRMISFPKDGQVTSKRFEQLHLQYPEQVNNTKVMPDHLAERTMAVHSDSGAIWLRGEVYEGAVSGNYIDLQCGATLIGATVETGTDGKAYLQFGDKKIAFFSSELISVNEKPFVNLSAFVSRFGLSIVEEDGVKIVSENDDWSVRQKKAFRYAVDLFSTQP